MPSSKAKAAKGTIELSIPVRRSKGFTVFEAKLYVDQLLGTQEEFLHLKTEEKRKEEEDRLRVEAENKAEQELQKQKRDDWAAEVGYDLSAMEALQEGVGNWNSGTDVNDCCIWESSIEDNENSRKSFLIQYSAYNEVSLKWYWWDNTKEIEGNPILNISIGNLSLLRGYIQKYYKWHAKAEKINLHPENKPIGRFTADIDYSGYGQPYIRQTVQVIYQADNLLISPEVTFFQVLYRLQSHQVFPGFLEGMLESYSMDDLKRLKPEMFEYSVSMYGRDLQPFKLSSTNGELEKFYAVIQPDNISRVRKSMDDFLDGEGIREDDTKRKDDELQRRIDAEFK